MTGSELVAVPDFSLLHDFCHGLPAAPPWAIILRPLRGLKHTKVTRLGLAHGFWKPT